MKSSLSLTILFFSLIGIPLLGSQVSLADETERGIRIEADRPIILSGMEGQVQAEDSQGLLQPTALKFGDPLQIGDRVHTGDQSRAELLVGHGELVTMGEQTTVNIQPNSSTGSVMELEKGTIRVAVAESQLTGEEKVSIQVHGARAHTRSGIFHVSLDTKTVLSENPENPSQSNILRVSYSPNETMVKAERAVLVYTVEEGTLTLEGNGQPLQVNAGQSLEIINGQTGVPFASTPRGIDPSIITPLTAVTQHRQTPKSGVDYVSSQEMKQAEVLGYVLSGVAAEKSETIEDPTTAPPDIILATTGATLAGGPSLPPSLPPNGNLNPIPPEVGWPVNTLLDPAANDEFNFVIGPDASVILKARGGGGLLLLDESFVTLNTHFSNKNFRVLFDLEGTAKYRPFNTELMLIDGGTNQFVPHQGVAPTERLTVTNLSGPIDINTVPTPPPPPGRNILLPIPIAAFNDPAEIAAAAAKANVLLRFSDPADLGLALKVLATYASRQEVNPESTSQSILFQPRFTDDGCCSNEEAIEGVNAVIRARDMSGEDPLTLKGGVALNDNTHLVATATQATSEYFQQSDDIDGSVVAILGRNFDVRILDQFPEDGQQDPFTNEIGGIDEVIPDFIEVVPEVEGGGQLKQVELKIEDRILAVLDNSTIKPDTSDPTNIPNIALLALLDSRLEGPTEPPNLIPGDVQPVPEEGQPPIPEGKSRVDIPGLIEIMETGTPNLDQADQAFQWAVEAHSAIVVRGELAPSILEASGPLVSMFQGTMYTTGDFANIQGNGTADSAQLMASLQQAGVLQGAVQLNNSQLKVGGHLFNFLNGATGDITGNLVALANNSTLTLEGVLLAVGLNSSFTLSGGSLVAFGFGTNTVNISGAGECAGCTLTTDIENLQGVPVLAHPTATINVGEGFVPYAGVGQGDMPMDFNNTVNVTEGTAVLHVGENANLTLNP